MERKCVSAVHRITLSSCIRHQCSVSLSPYCCMQMTQRLSLWKGSRAKSRSFVWKISPGWTEISSNVIQKSLKKIIIKKRGNSTFYPFACDDCQKCLHLQREVRTSVIARQKYDYIFYSILRSNISYGSISVYGASNTQFIALQEGYHLSRLRLWSD